MLQKEKQLDRATMSTAEKSDFIQKRGANEYFKLTYKGKCEEFPSLE